MQTEMSYLQEAEAEHLALEMLHQPVENQPVEKRSPHSFSVENPSGSHSANGQTTGFERASSQRSEGGRAEEMPKPPPARLFTE